MVLFIFLLGFILQQLNQSTKQIEKNKKIVKIEKTLLILNSTRNERKRINKKLSQKEGRNVEEMEDLNKGLQANKDMFSELTIKKQYKLNLQQNLNATNENLESRLKTQINKVSIDDGENTTKLQAEKLPGNDSQIDHQYKFQLHESRQPNSSQIQRNYQNILLLNIFNKSLSEKLISQKNKIKLNELISSKALTKNDETGIKEDIISIETNKSQNKDVIEEEEAKQITNISEQKVNNDSFDSLNLYKVDDHGNISEKSKQQDNSLEQCSIKRFYQEKQLKKIFLQEENLNSHQYFKQITQEFITLLNKNLFKQKCEIINYLTSGGEADIFTGNFTNQENLVEECAFRVQPFSDDSKLNDIKQEFEMIKSLKSPINIILYQKLIIVEEIGIAIIVCKKYEQSLIKFQLNSNNIDTYFKIIFDLIDGLVELRTYNILHFDIKPSNILLDKNDNAYYSDFGISQKLIGDYVVPKGHTKGYSSKEQQEYQKISNYQSDIFSLGQTFNAIIIKIEQNNDFKTKYINFITGFKQIIEKMQKAKSFERIECLDLIGKFIDLIGQEKLVSSESSVIQSQREKILTILETNKYEVSRDVHYFQDVNLMYSFIHLQLTLYSQNVYLTFNQVKSLEKESIKNFISQNKYNQQITQSLHMIGESYFFLGQFSIALKFFKDSIESASTYEIEIQQQSILHNSLLACFIQLSQFSQANLEYEKIISILSKNRKDNQLSIAITKNNFASCLNDQNEKDKALKLYKEVEEIYNNLEFINYYEYSIFLNNFGTLQNDNKNYESAIDLYQRSLYVKLLIYKSTEEPSIAKLLNNLATCQFEMNQDEEAIENLEICVQIMRKIYKNKSHADFALYLNNLGTFYLFKKKKEECFACFEESIKMKRELNNPQELIISLVNISQCFSLQQEINKAREYSSEAFSLLQKYKIQSLYIIALTLNRQAAVLNQHKEYQLAIIFYVEAVLFKNNYEDDFEDYVDEAITCSSQLSSKQISTSLTSLIQLSLFLYINNLEHKRLSKEIEEDITFFYISQIDEQITTLQVSKIVSLNYNLIKSPSILDDLQEKYESILLALQHQPRKSHKMQMQKQYFETNIKERSVQQEELDQDLEQINLEININDLVNDRLEQQRGQQISNTVEHIFDTCQNLTQIVLEDTIQNLKMFMTSLNKSQKKKFTFELAQLNFVIALFYFRKERYEDAKNLFTQAGELYGSLDLENDDYLIACSQYYQECTLKLSGYHLFKLY